MQTTWMGRPLTEYSYSELIQIIEILVAAMAEDRSLLEPTHLSILARIAELP